MEDKSIFKELKNGKRITLEATTLTGTGLYKGGTTSQAKANHELMVGNPVRFSSKSRTVSGSSAEFILLTGDPVDPATGGWGDTFALDNGNVSMADWKQHLKVVRAPLVVRNAVLDDIDELEKTVKDELVTALSSREGQSMFKNNDTIPYVAAVLYTAAEETAANTANPGQTLIRAGGVKTPAVGTNYGALNGLRGLDYYTGQPADGASVASSISATGAHTIATLSIARLSALTADNITDLVGLLPASVWYTPSQIAFHAHPDAIKQLRKLKDTSGYPIYFDILGEENLYSDGARPVGFLNGVKLIANPNLSVSESAGNNYPIYVGVWDKAVEIVDNGEVDVFAYKGTLPGFTTLFAEKKVATTVKDPTVLARLRLVA